MTAYVVNPPIRIDEQYYRDDEDIVQRALNGTRILAIGMRRSGKTSFLERVKRAATRENMAVVHCDVGMLSSGRDSSNRMRSLISAIERSTTDNTIILLDEVEGWNDVRRWPSQKLARVLNALNDSSLSLVMAAAPVFQPSECTQPNVIQRLVEPMQRHILGPLSETEARNLVSLSKTPGACPLSSQQIDEVLAHDDRLPLFLQAIAASAAGAVPDSVAVSGAMPRILSGLPISERTVLLRIAAGFAAGAPEADLESVAKLEAYGAIRRNDDRLVVVSGRLFKASLLSSSEAAASRWQPEDDAEEIWNEQFRILHLSDLHFGEHNREPNSQAQQLLEGLLATLKQSNAPDFVAITGDLTW